METRKTVQWTVPDMECEGCVRTLRRVLQDLPGVLQVEADLLSKRLQVEYNPQQTTPTALYDAIVSAGFTPQK